PCRPGNEPLRQWRTHSSVAPPMSLFFWLATQLSCAHLQRRLVAERQQGTAGHRCLHLLMRHRITRLAVAYHSADGRRSSSSARWRSRFSTALLIPRPSLAFESRLIYDRHRSTVIESSLQSHLV